MIFIRTGWNLGHKLSFLSVSTSVADLWQFGTGPDLRISTSVKRIQIRLLLLPSVTFKMATKLIKVFLLITYFLKQHLERPGAESVPRTYRSGAGRPKNIRIRIRNTGCHGLVVHRFCISFEVTFLISENLFAPTSLIPLKNEHFSSLAHFLTLKVIQQILCSCLQALRKLITSFSINFSENSIIKKPVNQRSPVKHILKSFNPYKHSVYHFFCRGLVIKQCRHPCKYLFGPWENYRY